MAATFRGRTVILAALVTVAALVGGIGLVDDVGAATPGGTGSLADARLTTAPRTAGVTSVHTVSATGAFDGNLSKVLVGYGPADVDEVRVRSLGVDRGADGDVDRVVPAAVGVRAGRVHVVPRERVRLTASDRVVAVLAGVTNPDAAGAYTARVTVHTDGARRASTAQYRVTPFPAPRSTVRNVTAPESSLSAVRATDSALRDGRIVRSRWRSVRFDDVSMRDVRVTADDWTRVTAVGADLRGVRSTRSAYTDVRFEGTMLRDVTVVDSRLDGVAVRPRPRSSDGDGRPLLAVQGNTTTDAAERLDAAVDERRDSRAGAGNLLHDVTLRDSALANVTLANVTLHNVTFRGVTLTDVRLRDVTLRDTVVTDRTLANGTVTDETVTSEREFVLELRTDDGVGDEAPVRGSARADGNVTTSTDGAVESDTTTGPGGAEGGVSA